MKNIRIRLYELDDAPALHEAAKESCPDVYRWLPWCHPEYKIKETEEWLAEQIEKRQEGTEFEFAILNSDGSYLGGCGLNGIDWEQKTANLGYWVRSSAMGQGIAVDAVELLSKWGFENTDLMRLEIKCAVENVRSQRVAEKAGAVREGIRKSCLEIHGKKHNAVVFVIKKDVITEQSASPDRDKPGR
jgi:ribosomal-protein-serine acetyltransferase